MEAIWAELLAQTEAGGDKAGEEAKQADGGTASDQTGAKKEQAGTKEDSDVKSKEGPPGLDSCLSPQNMVLMLAMFAIMYFVMIRPQKKRQKEQQQMLQNVTKNTRIRTIGGIIGTIVDVRDDEVVIKIDETTNTKMRIVRSAIGKVLTEDEQEKK